MMIFASVYAIVVGVAMIAQWTLDIIRHRFLSPKDDPVSGRGLFDMLFHWTAGIGLVLESTWGLTVYLIAMGMLIYTAINSPGFFAQQRKWSMVGMFAVILILTLTSLILVL